ncbi:hypothetical protein Emed_007346 [Eimeria media]
MGKEMLALLHTGATQTFVSSRLVEELQLQTKPLPEAMYLTVASGHQLDLPAIIPKVPFRVGNFCTYGRFLVAPLPYPIILVLDWLRELSALWDFGHARVIVFRGSRRFNLSVVDVTASDLHEPRGQAETDTNRGEALVRKRPERYKHFTSKANRVPIEELVAAARSDDAD